MLNIHGVCVCMCVYDIRRHIHMFTHVIELKKYMKIYACYNIEN